MNETMYYIKCYVVCKIKYRWAYYKLVVTQHQYSEKWHDNTDSKVLVSDWSWKVKEHIKRPEDTGKLPPEICNTYMCPL